MPALGASGTPGRAVALADVVKACKKAVGDVLSAAKLAKAFPDEAKALATLTRRLQSLLDELEDVVLDSASAHKGIAGLKALEQAVKRVVAVIAACATAGPIYLLLHQDRLLSEFVNSAIDVLAALRALDVKALKVDDGQLEAVTLLQGQLAKVTANYSPCAKAGQDLADLRQKAEELRVRATAGSPDTKRKGDQVAAFATLLLPLLHGCTQAQLAADVAFLQAELSTAEQAKKHVEAFFLHQVLAVVTPLLPADIKAAVAAEGDRVVRLPDQKSVTPSPEPEPVRIDPVPIVQELLKTLTTAGLPLEQRAAALRPLVIAAGLDPGGGPPDTAGLHGGAVLFALTDKECAAKVVALINEPSTEPLIKGWLLALVLSLVHPEKGLNVEVQQALVDSALPTALCRLVVRSTTPPEQRLQALTMLRVLAADPATHQPMMEAKVLNSLVQQVADVRVIKGQLVGEAPPTAPAKPAAPAKGAPPPGRQQRSASPSRPPVAQEAVKDASKMPQASGPAYDVYQQNIELAVMMIGELSPGPFKAEILTAGGVKALVHCVCNTGNKERVRAAAARALSVLLQDGAIAVEAARDNVLVGLLALAKSEDPAIRQAGLATVQQLLTPTPPSSAQTASVVASSLHAGPTASLPPQGKAAKLAARAGGVPSSSPSKASGAAAPASSASPSRRVTGAVVAPAPAPSPALAATDLITSMGKVLSPASTAALMELLALEDAVITPLVLAFLPLTATDPGCRAAILASRQGVQVLLRAIGSTGNAGASTTLVRVAADLSLKPQCGAVLAEVIESTPGQLDSHTHLAATLSAVGSVPAGAGRDKPSLASAGECAAVVLKAGAVPGLVALVHSHELRHKAEGVKALRMLALYGDDKVKAAIVKADALVHLVEATKTAVAMPGSSELLSQAAAEALGGLAGSETTQTQVFSTLIGYLSTPSLASMSCAACLAITAAAAVVGGAGSIDALKSLAKCAILNPLLGVLKTAPPTDLLQPSRLFAALTAVSQEFVDAANAVDAVVALVGVLEKGCAGSRAAAGAATSYLLRRAEKARNQLVDRRGLGFLLDVAKTCDASDPYFAPVVSALATLAMQHEGSRYELSRTLRTMMLRGGAVEAAAAAGACAQMARAPRGREILFSDDVIDALAKLLSVFDAPDAQRLAADALLHASGAGPVSLTPAAGAEPGAAPRTMNPKPFLVNKGCVDSLAQMLRSPDERVVYEATVCLESLCSSEEGLKAAKRIRVHEILHEVVQAGKRGDVGERTATAAYAAYLKVL